MAQISNLAYVHPEAKIGNNVRIDPFVFIDKDVIIGDNCIIHSHTSIRNGARIGSGNIFYDGCVISASPQDFRWKGVDSHVYIGDNNIIREHVIVNRSIHADGKTQIGSGSYILAQTHIGHDSVIGNHCVLGNAVKIAGNVNIGDYTILSSNALVHEGYDVGRWCLIKGGCRVTNNVPPFIIMAHNPVSYYGVNAYILRKGGFNEGIIDDIAKCYRHVYQCHTSPFNAVNRIQEDVAEGRERNEIISFIVDHKYKIAAISLEEFGE